SGLRTNICHSPSTRAATKATKAIQKCASTSRLARNTAHPLPALCFGQKYFSRQHLNAPPHCPMPRSAVLMARHQALAGLVESGGEGGDEAGDQHHVRVGLVDDEAVDDIGAGRTEGDWHARRNHKTLRLEGILLRNKTDDDFAVRTQRRAQVVLDELARDVQLARVDGFD